MFLIRMFLIRMFDDETGNVVMYIVVTQMYFISMLHRRNRLFECIFQTNEKNPKKFGFNFSLCNII